jgi:hypothetical protein
LRKLVSQQPAAADKVIDAEPMDAAASARRRSAMRQLAHLTEPAIAPTQPADDDGHR